MQLKWDQGLASRGKLKGKKTFENAIVPATCHQVSGNIRWADTEPRSGAGTLKRKRETCDHDKCGKGDRAAGRECNAIALITSELPRLSKSPTAPVPEILLQHDNARLFHHYLNHVAKVTVVRNTERNPFRTIICPMSFESPLIMSNILAIAAANLSNASPEYGLVAYQHLNNAYSELKERLANPKLALTEITLAGVLGQVSCQLHFGDLSNWRVHLTAARGIVNALGGPRAVLASRPDFRFYIQHLAWLDTLAATTSSTKQIGQSEYWEALLQSIQGQTSSYGMKDLMGCPEQLLEIIADMTRRFDDELDSTQAHDKGERHMCEPRITPLSEEGLEVNEKPEFSARERLGTEFEMKLNALAPEHLPQDAASALHEIFRIATKIYLTYRIMHTTCWSASLQSLLREALRLLELIPHKSSEEMALPWPLFIMGSICVYAREQKIIQARYAVMTKYMGFGNIHRCIELLQEVWAGWREAEIRSCPARIAGEPWDERELGRRRWEDVMAEKGYDLLLA